jgi:ubiquinol-cytochrome c reductase cytochrome b subunit
MPALLLLMFIVMPFVDKGKKYRWQDRPLFTALGVTSLGQIAVTTVWGFYIDPDTSLPFVDRIFIDPFSLWMSMLLIAFFSFVGTYSFIKVMQKSAEAKKVAKKPPFIVNAPVNISQKWIWVMLVSVILFMVYLNLLAFQAYESGFHNLALLELGGILVSFSAVFHLYRYAKDALMK